MAAATGGGAGVAKRCYLELSRECSLLFGWWCPRFLRHLLRLCRRPVATVPPPLFGLWSYVVHGEPPPPPATPHCHRPVAAAAPAALLPALLGGGFGHDDVVVHGPFAPRDRSSCLAVRCVLCCNTQWEWCWILGCFYLNLFALVCLFLISKTYIDVQ